MNWMHCRAFAVAIRLARFLVRVPIRFAHIAGGRIVMFHSELLGMGVARIVFRFGNRDGTMNLQELATAHFIVLI